MLLTLLDFETHNVMQNFWAQQLVFCMCTSQISVSKTKGTPCATFEEFFSSSKYGLLGIKPWIL